VLRTEPEIIACSPAPRAMAKPGSGACYSPTLGWRVESVWSQRTPQICRDVLVVLEKRERTLRLRELRLQDGRELSSRRVTHSVKDLCTLARLVR
jgi:hypothetical protein